MQMAKVSAALARFDKVGGLGAGDPVHVRGISMGKVTAVELNEQGVIVRLRLDGSVRMRDDVTARLRVMLTNPDAEWKDPDLSKAMAA